MKARMRLLVALVVLLSTMATAFFWTQNLRYQAQLREQVLSQAAQRGEQLADAMAGQLQGDFSAIDLTLKQLRRSWDQQDESAFGQTVIDALASLPTGLVSHAVIADAQGRVRFNSLGLAGGVNIADRDYFRVHLAGSDRMSIGLPVRSRLDGRWVFAVSRPLLSEGRFAGTVHLTLTTDFLAAKLAALELSAGDVVALIHPTGRFLARSTGNAQAMEQVIPLDRPYLADAIKRSGVYRVPGKVDGLPRTYGWHRLAQSGVVVAIGLADDTVLGPLAPAMQRSKTLAIALSSLMLVGGCTIAWLLWRVGSSQAAAGESEARLKEAQHLARVGNWEYEFAQDQLVWSEEMYAIFGLDRHAAAITRVGFRERVHPQDVEALQRRYQDLKAPGTLHDATFRICLPDAGVKHVRMLWVNEFEGGQPLRSRGTLQDVEAMHSVQTALLQLNEQLEQRVEERTRELGAVNRELEAFSYSVSHDLRTPLRSIHGFATLLEAECKDLPREGVVYLKRIQDAAKRMGVLITDLLSMAHHSRAPLVHQRVDLSDLARDIQEELEHEDPERRVQWTIEDGLQAQADPILMRVVLQNFLVNAWKYSRNMDAAHISFTRSQHSQGAQEFCVRDNGAGFDMAYAEQLFQPFKRLHTNQQFEGSGVGLATVQRLVQRHGGSVRGEGVVGQGAVFCFSLPDAPATQNVDHT